VSRFRIAVLFALIVFFSVRSGGPKGEKVYAEPAARKTIEAVVTAPGQIDPKVKVNISAHIVGKIEKLYFNEGDTVKRGQKLVELEKPLYVFLSSDATIADASGTDDAEATALQLAHRQAIQGRQAPLLLLQRRDRTLQACRRN